MKNHMTETEMKNLANANTQYFMDDYGNFQKATQEEHKIFYNLFYRKSHFNIKLRYI